MRSVASASATSVVQPSSTGAAASGTDWRWSLTQTSSSPAASARRAPSRSSAKDEPKRGSRTPSRGGEPAVTRDRS